MVARPYNEHQKSSVKKPSSRDLRISSPELERHTISLGPMAVLTCCTACATRCKKFWGYLTNLCLRSRANLPQKGTNIETGPRYRDHFGCEIVCVE